MTSAVTAVFFVHTVLCAGYVAYLLKETAVWAGRRFLVADGDDRSVSDEMVIVATGHSSLLLYLFYAEAYLYRSYHLLN